MVFTKDGPKHRGRSGRYVGHHWYDDIEVIPDAERVLPVTVPHEVIAEHWITCHCVPCSQYPEDLRRHLKQEALRSSRPPRRAPRRTADRPPAA